MRYNTKFGITLFLALVSLLFLFFITSQQVHAEEKEEIKPAKELVNEKELPQVKKLNCNPEIDMFHQLSCIYV